MAGLSKHWMTSTSRGSSTIEPNLWLKALLDMDFTLQDKSLGGLMEFLAFLVQKLWPNVRKFIRGIPSNSLGQGYSIILRTGPVGNVKLFGGLVTPIKSCKCEIFWIFLTRKYDMV